MSENEKEEKTKPRLRGWVGKKGGAEEVSSSVENKIKAAAEKEKE